MRLGTAALTLTLAFGVVGMASAQESRGWFGWLWPASKATTDQKAEAEAKADKEKSAASATRLKKAKADWDRRREVCDKLRDIAIAAGDDELLRKSEQLDQRAWDLFLAAKNRLVDSQRPIGTVNASDIGLTKKGKKGGR